MHDPGFFVRCNIFCVPSLFVLLSFSRSCSLNCAFVRRLRVPRTSWVFSTIFFFLLFQYCLFTSNTIFFFSKFRKYPRRPVRDSWRLISNAKKKNRFPRLRFAVKIDNQYANSAYDATTRTRTSNWIINLSLFQAATGNGCHSYSLS